jgi:predicted nucleic acid-binding protein
LIVVDASVVYDALIAAGPARERIANEALFAPHLIDTEVASTLRRAVAAGRITADQGWQALAALRQLGIHRYPAYGLVDRVWALRDNLTTYDATYVAVAEALDCGLLTGDRRLAGAPGIRCPVTVIPAAS